MDDVKIDELIKKDTFIRNRFTNKGDYGRAAVIAGDKSFLGASYMSFLALSALRMGAGYSTLIVPSSLFSIYALKEPQIIISPLPSKNDEFIIDDNFTNEIKKYDSIAVGMGLKESKNSLLLLNALLNNFEGNLILDGSALNLLAKEDLSILSKSKAKIFLTPHIKEFSRLVNIDVNRLKKRLADILIEFTKKYNVTVLVKDAYSYASKNGKILINKHGNAALAKAGSGDLLAGILLGLVTSIKNEDALTLIALSAYILGRCAELYVKENNEITMLYEDVIKLIPKVINELTNLNH